MKYAHINFTNGAYELDSKSRQRESLAKAVNCHLSECDLVKDLDIFNYNSLKPSSPVLKL
jgi:hypothetical protein